MMMLTENPRGFLEKPIPPEMTFLQGDLLDLCFENLGIDENEQWILYKALRKASIGIPGTNYRIRLTPRGKLVVEPVDGTEMATLPKHWKQAIYVLNANDEYVWIGRLVKQDQIGTFDRTTMTETEDGFGR